MIWLLSVLIFINVIQGFYENNSEINIISMQECETDNPDSENNLICHTQLVETDGIKAFNANISLKTDFDESFTYNLSLSFPETNNFKFSMKGELCKDIFVFIPGLWKKMSEIIGVSEKCPIPAGDYNIENFQISTKESGFPFTINKEMMIKVLIYKDDLPVLCREFIIKPNVLEER